MRRSRSRGGRPGPTALALGLLLVAAVGAQEQSLLERWEETLQYGIDSEIASILSEIEQSGETGLDDRIVDRFERTRNEALRREIVEHFTGRESPALADSVRTLLLSEEVLSNELLRVSSTYLSRIVEDPSPALLERYAEIAEDGNLLTASVAIEAIGRNGSEEAIGLLLGLYERLTATDLRAAVIRALGDTGSEEALPLLTRVASDVYEESSLRQYASESLGRIGAAESLPLLTSLLGAEDSLLRAYATSALGYYETEEAASLLQESLLDSFWRVRVAALEALGRLGRDAAVPAIAYKARRDPERPVRQEAIRSLGALATEESIQVLRDLARDERYAPTERILSVEQLAEVDSGANATVFEEIAAAEWEREDSRLLDAVGRAVTAHPDARLAPLYTRLLTHPNFIIRIYGMRGVGSAGLSEAAEELKRIARENPPGLVRRTALTALERLGIVYDPEAAPADEGGTTEESGEAPRGGAATREDSPAETQ